MSRRDPKRKFQQMIHSKSGFPNLASSLARSDSSGPIYGLLEYWSLDAIGLFSKVSKILCPGEDLAAACSWRFDDVLRRIKMEDFSLLVLGESKLPGIFSWKGDDGDRLEEEDSKAGGDSGLEGSSCDTDRSGMLASEIKSRESRCVGGLLSSRESDMHHDPSGGAPNLVGSARATKKVIFHRRPLAINSKAIPFDTIIRLWNMGITKVATNAAASEWLSSTSISSGGVFVPNNI